MLRASHTRSLSQATPSARRRSNFGPEFTLEINTSVRGWYPAIPSDVSRRASRLIVNTACLTCSYYNGRTTASDRRSSAASSPSWHETPSVARQTAPVSPIWMDSRARQYSRHMSSESSAYFSPVRKFETLHPRIGPLNAAPIQRNGRTIVRFLPVRADVST